MVYPQELLFLLPSAGGPRNWRVSLFALAARKLGMDHALIPFLSLSPTRSGFCSFLS